MLMRTDANERHPGEGENFDGPPKARQANITYRSGGRAFMLAVRIGSKTLVCDERLNAANKGLLTLLRQFEPLQADAVDRTHCMGARLGERPFGLVALMRDLIGCAGRSRSAANTNTLAREEPGERVARRGLGLRHRGGSARSSDCNVRSRIARTA
ncbi:hypothetical protein [Aurantimonas sp. HBX-1]|uniref:hypothetical protein n=1 Tax=Aurantimonas sp. HBX-1 TaxID=2906072 RepID=UPI001F3899E3|nr:hypothetical protein [Aurantimonas sp. HBX-1]UIJ70324.1 hypothetical protein LXB15_11085 [Aurantimonas sp. HBX-1]